jgi:hypothetical protein
MKLLFVALFVAAIPLVHAKVITVSNSPLNPGQFTSLNLAMSVAIPGDTIYVQGSTINYGSAILSRPGLVVIGTGHSPQKQFPLVASFTDIDVFAQNCQLIGIVAQSIRAQFGNFTMKRCKILGPVSGAGPGVNKAPSSSFNTVLLEGNVFTGGFPNFTIQIGVGDNITIRNNIFSGLIEVPGLSAPASLLVANNIFLKGPTAFFVIDYAILNNNIFFGSAPLYSPSAHITASNNITFQCINDFFPAGPNTTLSNNLEGVNPQFVNYPPFPGDAFSIFHDYHLAPGSPGLGTGSDGTDRGVYGGFSTYFNMTGEPAIAEISSVTITSPTTVAPNGTLDITVVSKRVH